MLLFDGYDVIEEAKAIVKLGALENACCDFCCYCAISQAKDTLDDRYKAGVSLDVAMTQVIRDVYVELPSDQPLVDAREALNDLGADLEPSSWDQKKTLKILQTASEKVKRSPFLARTLRGMYRTFESWLN